MIATPTQQAELTPMQQSWRGVLPCADCEGIETSLFLEKDGTWVMNERYQGVRREPSSFGSYGTWARTADKLVLTDALMKRGAAIRAARGEPEDDGLPEGAAEDATDTTTPSEDNA